MEQFNKGKYYVIAAGLIALSLVICALVLANPLSNFASSKTSIVVTGAAKKEIVSDFAVWSGSFYQESADLAEAYGNLKNALATVKSYLVSKGVPEDQIIISSISTMPQYIYNQNGNSTGQISSYRLSQTVEIKSNDVQKIASIARESTELIEQGLIFESLPPQYFYTKLNDLKVNILAEATKNAKERAEKMATSTGSNIGAIRSAKMGVFQITPVNSNEISDYGINDTSSIEKEITAVVNVEFAIK
ncbi:SIMPL domain-containing protein [Desulfotomaculum sp. 1211_IL3151]|uniref:SIMPL domain-containing protein n=1 Tax=Desulfotomaculum sp. 1211_IL3151 TaxID=3084055 RepID=UPI002FDB2790